MTNRFALRFLAGIFFVFATQTSAIAEEMEHYQVVLSSIHLAQGERVVGFEIKVNAGAIDAVKNLPAGWHFDVDNDASWMAKIVANTTVGAGAIDEGQLKNIKIILLKNEFEGLQFDVAAEVIATTDFQSERHISLPMSRLHIMKL